MFVPSDLFPLKEEDDLNLAEGPRPYLGVTCTREDAVKGRRFPTHYKPYIWSLIKVNIKNTCLAWKLTNKFERISYFQVWWSCYSDRIWIQNGFWGDGKNIKEAVSIYISLCFGAKMMRSRLMRMIILLQPHFLISLILCFGRNFDVDIRDLRISTDCFWKFSDLPSSSI